ncbi:MAG TPA: histidine phosphatase family protein [Bryobacteraceae bacterium]|nr:histidine phosphatase family protein [Bryobacteraceae bacterium]
MVAGWQAGWGLNSNGKAQIMNLAKRLSLSNIRAIYTSPLERAMETAQLLAEVHHLTPIVREGLGEMRVGRWEGRTFESLRNDARWQRFNTVRTTEFPPDGERMIEVQARIARESEEIRLRHPDETVAVVSHGDPLRALVSYYLGIPIDLIQRFEIGLASVTTIRFDDNRPVLLCLNDTGELSV